MEAFGERHLAMKSAYTSKFYLEQPRYASPILFPQIMASLGKHSALGGNISNWKQTEGCSRRWGGGLGRLQRSLPACHCVLTQDTATVGDAQGTETSPSILALSSEHWAEIVLGDLEM